MDDSYTDVKSCGINGIISKIITAAIIACFVFTLVAYDLENEDSKPTTSGRQALSVLGIYVILLSISQKNIYFDIGTMIIGIGIIMINNYKKPKQESKSVTIAASLAIILSAFEMVSKVSNGMTN